MRGTIKTILIVCIMLAAYTFAARTMVTAASGRSDFVLAPSDSIDPTASTSAGKFLIPNQSDWTLQGPVLTSGPVGSWDVRLHGQMSPCTVIKKDDTFFLYYVGADGDRSSDGGPRHRALGVATSEDGINFERYDGNPIITHLPNNNEEEGVYSCGATLDANERIILYFSALDAGNETSTLVDSDVRLAISDDGFHFTEVGDVLSHDDPTVWGWGDELFPVGIYEAGGSWQLYYIADGISTEWDLGLAWGLEPEVLTNTQAVLTQAGQSRIISGGDPVWLSSEEIALFLVRDFDAGLIEVRTASANNPAQLSDPVESYDFGDYWQQATIYMDSDSGTWLMYQTPADGGEIYLRTASVTVASPPEIVHDPSSTNMIGQSLSITATVTSLAPPLTVSLHYGQTVEQLTKAIVMDQVDGNIYAANIPATGVEASALAYSIQASDSLGSTVHGPHMVGGPYLYYFPVWYNSAKK